MVPPRQVTTAAGPVDAIVAVPGSKSIANRALVIAALADGDSELTNVPDGDDTAALIDGLGRLGLGITAEAGRVLVAGRAGRIVGGTSTEPARVDARLAGTTSRFLTALSALARGPVLVDGAPPLRRRPMGPLHDALGQLGVTVATPEGPGTLPATVAGGLRRGGTVALAGHVSSQFLSALMMVGPLLEGGLVVELTSPLVSVPYVELTSRVMADFGVTGVEVGDRRIAVPAGAYRARSYHVEPDASSASYALALAAVAGGRVTVPGLTRGSAQGDVAFAEMLGAMGCRVVARAGPDLVVERDPSEPLRGLEADLADTSDLVPTVAAVAVTASSPTRITGVGFIRAKESDRLGDLAAELGALGARVVVEPDGLLIEPAPLHGGTVRPHHDHRLAMAFGVVGAAVPGVVVEDPDVVAKSWPGYWEARDRVVAGTRRGTSRLGVAAFDVDGTLTTTDCVVPFLRVVAGTGRLAGGLARRGVAALSAAARRDRDELKALSAAAAFAGRSIAQIEGLGRWFAATFVADHVRTDTMARLRWHQAQGHVVVLVSASFGAYLRPWAESLGGPGRRVDVLATELVALDGRATGELRDGNCRGAEKRRRLEAWLDDEHGGRDTVELWAYGDSAGDDDLLAAADHPVRITSVPLGLDRDGAR